jgi:hypothetical protein
MDYQVFLLSRIKERYDETGDPTDAVTFGVASTARIITGAALIIVAVFAGFAAGELIMFQQMGFGVAVALLIDATIIRSVVLPSAMKLLRDWNWYLHRWLTWLPRLQVEGPGPAGVLAFHPQVDGVSNPSLAAIGSMLSSIRICSSSEGSYSLIRPTTAAFARSGSDQPASETASTKSSM